MESFARGNSRGQSDKKVNRAKTPQFKCIVKNCEKKGNFSRIIWKFLIKRK